MSRIGKQPIAIPGGVKVNVSAGMVEVSGPKGKLSQAISPEMAVDLDNGVVTVSRPSDARHHRALHGLTRALIQNMVEGVSEGFTRRLLIEGVGYRAEMNGKTLVLNVGYSHPVPIEPVGDIAFEVLDRGRTIIVTSADKQLIGEVCAQIRKMRPPEPYKGKGIRYEGETVRRKAGKAGKV